MLEQLWGLLFGLGGGGGGAERGEEADPVAATHPRPQKKYFFSSPREEVTLPQKREGVSPSTRKAERNLQRERHRCAAAAASSLRPAGGRNAVGERWERRSRRAANAAAAAARAPSRRVHSVSPGGCSGSTGTAPSSARPPRSAPAPPPPRPAHRRRRRRRRPPQPSPAPARAHAHTRTRPPRAGLGALPPPRPRPAGHVARRAPSAPAPSPVVECVESKRLRAGRAPEPRACALGRPGLRTGGGGERGVGSEGGMGGAVAGAACVGPAVAPRSERARVWKP